MERQLKEEARRTDICLRFIDWFSERGVNYEHNIRAIDTHLDRWARGSVRGAAEDPLYKGSVRFTEGPGR